MDVQKKASEPNRSSHDEHLEIIAMASCCIERSMSIFGRPGTMRFSGADCRPTTIASLEFFLNQESP